MRRWVVRTVIAVLLLLILLLIVFTLLDAYSNAPLYRSTLHAIAPFHSGSGK